MMSPATSRLGRALGKRILVCAEGETEENYLISLRRTWGFQRERLELVQCRGTDPESIVKALRQFRDQEKRKRAYDEGSGDSCWAIFDVDEHRQQNLENFNRAVALAGNARISLALSNPNFELWAAQHFFDITADTHRDDMLGIVRRRVPEYDKNYPAEGFVRNFADLTDDALRRGDILARRNQGIGGDPFRNPSTRLHELVREIRTLAP